MYDSSKSSPDCSSWGCHYLLPGPKPGCEASVSRAPIPAQEQPPGPLQCQGFQTHGKALTEALISGLDASQDGHQKGLLPLLPGWACWLATLLGSASNLMALTSPNVTARLMQNLGSLLESPDKEIKTSNSKTNSKADLLPENSFLVRDPGLVGVLRGQALCGWGRRNIS